MISLNRLTPLLYSRLTIISTNWQGRESFSKEILDERHSRAEDWHRQGVSKAQSSRPAQPINCATYAQDVIEGRVPIQPTHTHTHGAPMLFGPASMVSGSLSTDRERQIAQVFQPSHRYASTGRRYKCYYKYTAILLILAIQTERVINMYFKMRSLIP